MTQVPSILACLTLATILLSLIGEPLRLVLTRKLQLFSQLDVLQSFILDVYLGGFVLHAIAVIPVGLYKPPTIYLLIAASGLAIVMARWREITSLPKLRPKMTQLQHLGTIPILLTLAMSAIVVTIHIMAEFGFLFGNVHDLSLHSLLVKVIIENGYVPETLQPYEATGIIYPQGFHVIVVFYAYLLKVPPAEITFLVMPVFQGLVVLGAYFLGKSLSNRREVGALLAFAFTFISRWPKLLLWGSNAYVAGFPFYLVLLGMLPLISRCNTVYSSPLRYGKGIWQTAFMGLLIGYLGAIHVIIYEVFMITLFLAVAWKSASTRQLNIRVKNLGLLSLFSSLPILVYLYRFVSFYPLPGHNVGIPSDAIESVQSSLAQTLEEFRWGFITSDWLSPYEPMRLELLILIASGVIFAIWIRNRDSFTMIRELVWVSALSQIGAIVLMLLSSRETGIPLLSHVVVWEVGFIIYVSAIIFVGSFYASLLHFIRGPLIRTIRSRFVAIAVAGIVLLSINAAPIYFTFAGDLQYARSVYQLFAVTQQADLELMNRIIDRLPRQSNILVNPYDAGSFIPVISGYKVTYPFTGSRASKSYQILIESMRIGNLSRTEYDLMEKLQITHVFIGSKAVYTTGKEYIGEQRWDPSLFLNDPNFALVDRVQDSYLFSFVCCCDNDGVENILCVDPSLITPLEDSHG